MFLIQFLAIYDAALSIVGYFSLIQFSTIHMIPSTIHMIPPPPTALFTFQVKFSTIILSPRPAKSRKLWNFLVRFVGRIECFLDSAPLGSTAQVLHWLRSSMALLALPFHILVLFTE